MSQRNCIPLSVKVKFIEAKEKENLSIRCLAKRFGIGKSQAARIVKNKEQLLSEFRSGGTNFRKNKLVGNKLKLDERCREWITEKHKQREPINGPMLKTKAREIAKSLGLDDFMASNGWLNKFRKRHNIDLKFEPMKLENPTPEDNDKDEKLSLSDVLCNYSSPEEEEVFIAEGNSFFFKSSENRSEAFKAQKRRKLVKEKWLDVPNKICSSADALKYVHNLKLFLKDDFAAFHLAKNLESVIQHRIGLEQQSGLD